MNATPARFGSNERTCILFRRPSERGLAATWEGSQAETQGNKKCLYYNPGRCLSAMSITCTLKNMVEDQLLYVGQKAFIEKGGEVLILMDHDLGLDFPGGKIQEGEIDFTKSLKREVREETKLEIEKGDAFFT